MYLQKKCDIINTYIFIIEIFERGDKVDKLLITAIEALVRNTSDIFFIKDEKLIYRAASMPFVRMAGKESLEEVVGFTDTEIFEDKRLAARYIADDCRLFNGGKDLIDYVEPITDDNGNARYGSTSKYILRDENGKTIGVLGITKDITKEYLAKQRYQQEFGYLFELPADTYAVCYIDVDDWRIITQRRQNIHDGTIQECQTVEEMVEYALESIVDVDSDAAAFYRNFTAERLYEIYSSGRRAVSFKYQRKISDGSSRWIRSKLDFLADVDSGHLCVMLSAKDIDKTECEQQKLAEAAKLDLMTMLLNHESSMESIKSVLEHESGSQHALFMIDIDNFKALNDTLGHKAGDEFLIALSKELKNNFRESDILGRIGGDEFFVLMRNVTEQKRVRQKADEILGIIQNVASKYLQVDLSGSVGISMYPKNGTTLDELYSKSDEALYEAKRTGKNKYIISEA